ncbi:hypothetical protein P152DRAFT_172672 [Eremomyces bilateralis CBS 781.70]|uniref:Protein kinase domain-containing protein n=1 Tax=Eremomyces bilateralis CBS 781.70 TaxID=1392243 RepID=A0A6G1FU25_9PEZI|nr:uncharacterized protein P152DRAFT_172672 [Eremomyces bilateralis CBS 781.70]KAF1809208.1 hypothetical protein P152DRAFT_172672 [Eremomyces bilateralis CBS 781.70]
MQSGFVSERHFTSVHTLQESGETVRKRSLSSELDLHHFQRTTVEDPVALIIQQMNTDRRLQQEFGLQGLISFENHANALCPDTQLAEGIDQLPLSGNPPRRSACLHAKANESMAVHPAESAPTTHIRSSRPRADQFCVYNKSIRNQENRIPAFVMEYKAPHNLPLGYIYEGLDDMKLEDVIRYQESDAPRNRFRRLIAAIITQAFSYMINAGVEYGCVCTGEAFIFLRVPEMDPGTVHYFLSVPTGDVGGPTEWVPDSDDPNRLHLTAVGQMLAFTLQALKSPPRNQSWRSQAANLLNSWEVVYAELLDTIPLQDAPPSEYRPPRDDGFLRMSPVRLRRRPVTTGSSSCVRLQSHENSSDDELDPDTPSRERPLPRHSARTQATARSSSGADLHGGTSSGGQHCTQKCLLGLVNRGLLDMSCPNARDHGKSYHRICLSTFVSLVRRQLSEDLDTDCMPIGPPGSCGILFRIRLRSHGYTIAAKATDFAHRLKHEATLYDSLRPIQGSGIVPVYLGNIDLSTPYYYEGIAKLDHMMLMSFGGELLSTHLTTENRPRILRLIRSSIQAVASLGIVHNDLALRNMLWNEETGKVMLIDFERAQFIEQRPALGTISANRKRKRDPNACVTKRRGSASVKEMQQVTLS